MEISSFVAAKSERGKRAQAVAAGIIEASVGKSRVLCGRIHDPDSNFPGDVVVLSTQNGDGIERSFEVRDKMVNDADLNHFTVKLAEKNVPHGAVLCPVNQIIDESLWQAVQWAEERNIILMIYPNWHDFVCGVFFWSDQKLDDLLSRSSEAILRRLQDLEVSDEGIADWAGRF